MTRWTFRLALCGLLLGATWQLGAAAAIHGKAALGQVLLERAWDAGREQGQPPPPWPWADTAPVARMRVPHLGIDQIVLAGLDGNTLAWAPGMAVGSGGHRVIAGHRDTHFRFLRDIAPGHRFELETPDGTVLAWQVTATTVVDERYAGLDMDLPVERLTLITCYPFETADPGGPLRYIVSLESQP
ncbi:MAG TPA: class GN sortase [Xanthomonadaceae bacterium]|nr:class GN sortase [Xanthomonadaceae bacterium]